MNCLFCGKELNDKVSCGWHIKCIRSFWGIGEMPVLDISDSILEKIAGNNVDNGMTIPGVQKKLSIHLSKDEKYRLTVVNYPNGYIMKPPAEDYPCLPEAEHLVMSMADIVGIKTVRHGLLRIGERDKEVYAYITRRIDREIEHLDDTESVKLCAMEDFCQLSGRLTQDKYKGSYEQCAKLVKKYSDQPGLDLSELFLRLVFCFVTGNSDMHLKNFSLIEKKPGSRKYRLSEAYDLLPVNIVNPQDAEEMALTLCGRKNNIHKGHFLEYAAGIGLADKAAKKIIDSVTDSEDELLDMCDDSLLTDELKENLHNLIKKRMGVLRVR